MADRPPVAPVVQGEADFIYAKFPSDFFCLQPLQARAQAREKKKKFGRSLNIVIPRKREKQNVIVHMDIKEEEKGNINVCIVF